ncbi:efflux RND transporter periplasmic adaptor subunit [candidate division KSB1 bacterium]|nr:efflux RND transporter periplasmic adaptor subunit [candidate division KSB1 bacterium]
MKKSYLVFMIPIIITVVAIVALMMDVVSGEKIMITGMIETTEIDVASKIPGRIDSIFVKEGDMVHQGQVLAKLGSKEIDAKVEQARSLMEAARAKMEMAQKGARPEEISAVEKLYFQAQYQFELAEKTYNRIQAVFKDSIISIQEKDQVEFNYKAAREQLAAAQAKFDMVKKGARIEEIHAAEALFRQAENGLREALAYQSETQVISPMDGMLKDRIIDPGEIAAAGYPIFSIINPEDVWLVVQLRENQIANLEIGQIVPVTISTGQEHEFKITYMASMADFASWRATNQKGDFDLKTFEIHLRPVSPIKGLRAGMTARINL